MVCWASGHVGLLVWSGEAEGDLRQGNRGHQSGAEGLSPRPSQRCLCRLWPVWREEEPAAQRMLTHCFPSQRPASGTDAATAQLGSAFDGSQSALWHSLQDGSKFTDQNPEEHGWVHQTLGWYKNKTKTLPHCLPKLLYHFTLPPVYPHQ